MEDTLQSGNLIKKLCVVAFCSLGASFSLFLLYQDVFNSSYIGTGKVMASVEQLSAQVKRKSSESYLWARVKNKDLLYEKESIQTGHDSYAKLKMNSGSVLEIGEDSLIVLENVEGVSLNFLNGNFILRDKDQDLKIQVSKGNKKVEKLPIRLELPTPNAEFYSFPRQAVEVEFSFQKESAQKKVILEISEVKTFAASSTKTFSVNQKVKTKLTKGTYYWRMRSDDGASEVRKLFILEVSPVKLLSPVNLSKIKQYKNIEGIEFKWSSDNSVTDKSEHFLEISHYENFEKLLYQDTVFIEKGFYYLPKALQDKVFWRIRSEYPGKSVLSEKSNFTSELVENWEVDLAKPVNQEMFLNNRAVDFIWDFPNLLQEVSSSLVVKNLETQKTDIKISSQNRYQIDNLDVGKYSWKVILKNKDKVIKESKERVFHVLGGKNIQLLKPLKGQQFLFWKSPEELVLEWGFSETKVVPTHYEIEFADNQDFKKVIGLNKVERSSLKITPGKAGTYYWRVKAYKGNDFIGMSEVSSYLVMQYGKLVAPEIVFPNTNELIRILSSEEEPVFRWQKLENAEKYKIEINTKNKKIFSKVLVENSIKVKDLPDGEYVVTVSAIDPIQREGQVSLPVSFKVDHGVKLAPPMKMKVEVE